MCIKRGDWTLPEQSAVGPRQDRRHSGPLLIRLCRHPSEVHDERRGVSRGVAIPAPTHVSSIGIECRQQTSVTRVNDDDVLVGNRDTQHRMSPG